MELAAFGGFFGALAGGWIGWTSSGEGERLNGHGLLRMASYAVFGSIVVFVLSDFVAMR
jgi:hypothetical protein